jgi:hypothetical protein
MKVWQQITHTLFEHCMTLQGVASFAEGREVNTSNVEIIRVSREGFAGQSEYSRSLKDLERKAELENG